MNEYKYLFDIINKHRNKNRKYSNFLFSLIGVFPEKIIEETLKLAEDTNKRVSIVSESSEDVSVDYLQIKDWE